MGLRINEILTIIQLYQSTGYPEGGSLCMLGKQDIVDVELPHLMKLVELFKLNYDKIKYDQIRSDQIIDSYELFKLFGFSEVYAVDYSDYEGANIIFDLNSQNIPDELNERFDFVIDGGTLEHIFDQATALKNMSKMVKKGGYIYHAVPLAGLVNHGFYSISPTLFLDYYIENRWKINTIDMEFRSKNGESVFSQDIRLYSNEVNEIVYNMLKLYKVVLLRCIARKKEESTVHKNPIQGLYSQIYKVYQKIDYNRVIEYLKDNISKKIALYGAGKNCENLINELYINDIEEVVSIIFDTKIDHAGKNYRGFKIMFPTDKKLKEVDIVLISSSKYVDEIYEYLRERGVEENKICKITEFV